MKKNFFQAVFDAGLIAGFILIGFRMLLVIIVEAGKFTEVFPTNTIFQLVIFGYFIHFILVILFTCVIGFIVLRMNLTTSLWVGLVMGLCLWFINSYVFIDVFPWFSKTWMWVSVFMHLVYGLVAVWCFKSFYDMPPATASLSR